MAAQFEFRFGEDIGYSVGGMVVSQLLAQGVDAAHSVDHPMHGRSRLLVYADDRDGARSRIDTALRAVVSRLQAERDALIVK